MLKKKLRKSTKRSNVIIQLNPANPVGGGGGVVLRISSDRDARRIFLGSKVWISGRKIFGKYLFG